MMQRSDKELDKLIRDAAEENEASGAVPNWEGMQALLDDQLPAGNKRRRRPVIVLLFLSFLVAGGLYFYFSNKENQPVKDVADLKQNTEATETPKDASSSVTIPSQTTKPVAPGGDGNSNNHNASDNNPDNSQVKNQPLRSTVLNHSTIDKTGKPALLKKHNKGRSKMTITAATSGEENESATNNNEQTIVEDHNRTDIPEATNAPNKPTTASDLPINEVGKTTNTKEDKKLNEKKEPADSSVQTSKKKKDKTRKAISPLEFTLLYAPELTTIHFSNIDKPGNNFGLLIGYQVSKNIMLQTGIIKSRKNYTAKGEDFKTSNPYAQYKLYQAVGYCTMYEIPLNLKYQLSHGRKIQTSLTAGLSSYILTGEAYTYKYVGSNYTHYQKYSAQKNYWLALATIGVGFEKGISKNFKVGATPFMRIPFKGMGTGDLKLLSTGVSFSVSYRPSFSK